MGVYRKRRYMRGRRPSLLERADWMCSYEGSSVRSPRAATAGLLRSILVVTLLMSLAVTLPGNYLLTSQNMNKQGG